MHLGAVLEPHCHLQSRSLVVGVFCRGLQTCREVQTAKEVCSDIMLWRSSIRKSLLRIGKRKNRRWQTNKTKITLEPQSLLLGWQEWNPTEPSYVVAHPHKVSPCSFWDAFPLNTLVQSGYLFYCALPVGSNLTGLFPLSFPLSFPLKGKLPAFRGFLFSAKQNSRHYYAWKSSGP